MATSQQFQSSPASSVRRRILGALAPAELLLRAGLPALIPLPALAVAGSPVRASVAMVTLSIVFALVAAVVSLRVLPRGRGLALAGWLGLVLEFWALRFTASPGAGMLAGPFVGVCVVAVANNLTGGRPPFAVAGLLTVALCLARFEFGRETALLLGIGWATAALVPAFALPRPGPNAGRSAVLLSACVLLVFAYQGGTMPAANWFGAGIDHGPRNAGLVALTFDDGPDTEYSLMVADILDSYGVKGTFFLVGKALSARPDIARELLNRGEVLGNHSYNHDSTSWLRPDYPELDRAQRVFREQLGICPAFFRPPHGSRTPFVTRKASRAGMKTIMWDVSAADWATSDGEVVAERVLSRVRPGSIVLLHDGIDGNLHADRSVLLSALPLILDGLRDRGLKPVTLAELLGQEAYVPSC